MRFSDSWWGSLLYIFDFATLSTFSEKQAEQHALVSKISVTDIVSGPAVPSQVTHKEETVSVDGSSDQPIFVPPYADDDPNHGNRIECNYAKMYPQWKPCNNENNRQCWLKGPGGQEYNITTNYELKMPQGITRKYTLDITEKALAPDGVPMRYGKVFNDAYPGPWIQACWGDQLEITVRNHLRFNGTTIHWHGIRQLNNTEMDGVNAVTQCPIAPGQEFTYKFNATQYGSSWYHSHYSLQYADGLVGPMTIYGPSSKDYDYAEDPILMTDWNHRSAFEDWSYSIQPGHSRPNMTNILLNGLGRYVDPKTREIAVETKRYTKVLEKGKRYLLRLINTSVDTAFIFAIDGHNVTVVGSDFVPLKNPYSTRQVLIGIGQRYHVILEANPLIPAKDDNYWIRTIPADGCGIENFVSSATLLTNTGIIRYKKNNLDPTSSRDPKISTKCSDEPYASLTPMLEWKVGEPSNVDVKSNTTFEVGLQAINGHPYHPTYDRKLWNIDNLPLWLAFGEPSILNLNTPNGTWHDYLDVTSHDPQQNEWIYLVITATGDPSKAVRKPGRFFIPVAHPIHLHGHDFAILNQSTEPYPGFENVILNKENPPRRDVALLPQGGYLVLAFKADNPGTWLLHCHIAWHASSGLGMQILENTGKLSQRLTGTNVQAALVQTCNAWDDWVSDTRNHYNPMKPHAFQDDSGV